MVKHVPSLVAAAPDLLAACKRVLEDVAAVPHRNTLNETAKEMLRKAIAKAEAK